MHILDVANGYSDNILVKLFISEIVHTEDSFLLKLYYKFNFATEPEKSYGTNDCKIN